MTPRRPKPSGERVSRERPLFSRLRNKALELIGRLKSQVIEEQGSAEEYSQEDFQKREQALEELNALLSERNDEMSAIEKELIQFLGDTNIPDQEKKRAIAWVVAQLAQMDRVLGALQKIQAEQVDMLVELGTKRTMAQTSLEEIKRAMEQGAQLSTAQEFVREAVEKFGEAIEELSVAITIRAGQIRELREQKRELEEALTRVTSEIESIMGKGEEDESKSN